MLSTPGGDGETAIRLIRQAQSRCRELTVIVPDQASHIFQPAQSWATASTCGVPEPRIRVLSVFEGMPATRVGCK